MTNNEAELREGYCFWCGAYGSHNTSHCIKCGYEIGSYPPEVAALITEQTRKARIEELEELLRPVKCALIGCTVKHVGTSKQRVNMRLEALQPHHKAEE